VYFSLEGLILLILTEIHHTTKTHATTPAVEIKEAMIMSTHMESICLTVTTQSY